MNDELLVSYLLREGDAATRQRVEQWISENPANRKYFEHFRMIWEASQQLSLPASVDEHEAWQKFRKRTYAADGKKTVTGNFWRSAGMLRAAAAIIIGVSIVALSYFIWQNSSRPAEANFVAASQPVMENLPDGSQVTLNKNSSLQYKGKSSSREVALKGEAFFNVKADRKKPFVITINNIIVTVVGTSFNIKSADTATEVVVESGIVKVERNNRSVVLNAGQTLNIRVMDSALVPEQTAGKLYNYYITKEFVCDNTPLWKLVETLNEAYGTNIVIENPDILRLPLTTTFHNEPLDNILQIISETFNVTVEREADKIILK